jgi:hypothetical protein
MIGWGLARWEALFLHGIGKFFSLMRNAGLSKPDKMVLARTCPAVTLDCSLIAQR